MLPNEKDIVKILPIGLLIFLMVAMLLMVTAQETADVVADVDIINCVSQTQPRQSTTVDFVRP